MKPLLFIVTVLVCLGNKSYGTPTKNYEDSIISLANRVYEKWSSPSDHKKVIIVDFSKPIEFPRLFIVNIATQKIEKSTIVSHGTGSGMTSIPTHFSNTEGSKMSSKGVMRTAETYYGSWGYSMKIDGLQPGINSNARSRSIVFHNSDVQSTKWSWGCFSIPGNDYKEVIDSTKGGTLIYAFSEKEEMNF